ncbi:MAG: T9SS type A sorting domain-containing protein [Lentimicrobiaceae bacterium]|jgi:hypothetical protein
MNKKVYTFVAILATTFAGIVPAMGQYASSVTDTIYMGASYSNEIYYSMPSGDKGTVNRSQWDIAFRANRMSASILTNDGANVGLYSYPKSDTSGWATVDTSGLSNWTVMVNSTTDWEDGAFCRNQKGHPDYGWGKYNSVSHNVVGDSLFIIKLRDGSFRKLWIMEKFSSANVFEFRFANIDGTNDTTVMVDCSPYATKNFIGYSISTRKVVDFEPVVSAQWDLLITKYMYTYPDGTLYPVTGVLSNYTTKVKKFKPVAPDFLMSVPQTMDSTRSPIGWDWKSFNMSTFAYEVGDSLAYFVQNSNGVIYKLVFKEFVGSSTGRIVLEKEQISLTGVRESEKSGFNAAVYPNPVNDVLNLVINPGKTRLAQVTLLDMSGRTVLNKRYELAPEELSTLKIPVSGLRSGVYMIRIQSGTNIIARKIIVNN